MQPNDQQSPAPQVPEQQPSVPVASASPQSPIQPVAVPEYGAIVQDQGMAQDVANDTPASQMDPAQPSQLPEVEPVQWQAPEYIQHSKSPLWYVGFASVIVILMALAIILMRAWTFALLIPVMAAALMVYSHRPPRQINYVLSAKGIYINDQLHPLGEFKSFGVIQDPDHNTLVLIPVKRFKPGLSVFFPGEVGEKIVDLLGGYLPMGEQKPDLFDKIVRKLRI